MKSAPEELNQLQSALTAALVAQQIRFESRALFKPHITLARDAELPPQTEIAPIIWHAKQVTLMRSVVQDDGLQYDVLASHWLRRVR